VLDVAGRVGHPVPVATLLLVHHTPSPALQSLLEAVVDGARNDAIDGVEVVLRPALTCPETDVLAADGYLLGTPANLGYMSGALKHFFDRIYYPCLQATRAGVARGRRPAGEHRGAGSRGPGRSLGARRDGRCDADRARVIPRR
jgi:hypothetical protein